MLKHQISVTMKLIPKQNQCVFFCVPFLCLSGKNEMSMKNILSVFPCKVNPTSSPDQSTVLSDRLRWAIARQTAELFHHRGCRSEASTVEIHSQKTQPKIGQNGNYFLYIHFHYKNKLITHLQSLNHSGIISSEIT